MSIPTVTYMAKPAQEYDSIHEYLTANNVQLGGSYRVGRASTLKYSEGFAAAAKFVNAQEDEIGTCICEFSCPWVSSRAEGGLSSVAARLLRSWTTTQSAPVFCRKTSLTRISIWLSNNTAVSQSFLLSAVPRRRRDHHFQHRPRSQYSSMG